MCLSQSGYPIKRTVLIRFSFPPYRCATVAFGNKDWKLVIRFSNDRSSNDISCQLSMKCCRFLFISSVMAYAKTDKLEKDRDKINAEPRDSYNCGKGDYPVNQIIKLLLSSRW